MNIHKISLFFCFLIVLSIQTELNQAIKCIKDYTDTFKSKMRPKLFEIFKKSFPNTAQTTIANYTLVKNQQQTYIITGDITAMWLRDSTNQFLPYIHLPIDCPYIRELGRGLLNTQAQFIMIDGYTNAFKRFQSDKSRRPSYLNDKTQTLIFGIPVDLCRRKEFATQSIWQRKFEIDSLSAFLRLSYEYSKRYNTTDFINIRWVKAMKRILSVLDEQIKDEAYQTNEKKLFYTFFRDFRQLPDGKIKRSSRTGLIKTGFRPSDDPNDFPYNIPGNAMLSKYMELVATKVLPQIQQSSIFKSITSIYQRKLQTMASEIRDAIFEHGTRVQNGTKFFVYQINGFGDYKFLDDPNLPSLLSIGYLQFVPFTELTYVNTRKMVLSQKNPYYFANSKYQGQGSPHTPSRYIWPLGLITQILTTNDNNQIIKCLQSLEVGAKDNLMHQSFNINSTNQITRDWFAWANSFFGEMIIKLSQIKPELLK